MTPVARPRRKRAAGPLRILLMAGLLIAGIWAALEFIPRNEQEAIHVERYWRRAIVSFGWQLPGTPDLKRLDARLASHGLALGSPVFIRIFKREFELELWLQRDGRFHRFATYPICRWSGRLGPKLAQGDHQAPEGVYTVDKQALNPNSRWHKSFNLGFPNAYDQAHGRTGSYLMVHGGCGSVGCYAMTNPVIDEIWKLVTAALRGGQARFQVQVFPFRMSDATLARQGDNPNIGFWRNLKTAYDLFEASRIPPEASVCRKEYAFSPAREGSNGSAPVSTRCAGA